MISRKINLKCLPITTAFFVLASTQLAKAEVPSPELLKEAKISEVQATKTALAEVPNGKIQSSELEKENGKLIWSFDIATPKSKNIAEIQVDAVTGLVVSNEKETPKDQLKEKKADLLEKK